MTRLRLTTRGWEVLGSLALAVTVAVFVILGVRTYRNAALLEHDLLRHGELPLRKSNSLSYSPQSVISIQQYLQARLEHLQSQTSTFDHEEHTRLARIDELEEALEFFKSSETSQD